MPKRSLFLYLYIIALLVTSCNPQAAPTFPAVSSPTPASPTELPARVALFRANAQRTGIYGMSAIRHQPDVKWKTNVSTTWLMPPLVADAILHTGSGGGRLYGLNVETGEKLWSHDGFEAFESTGAAAADAFIAAGYSKVVKALNKKTGEELWSYRTDYAVQGAPLIVNDRVYVAT